jgi:GST-like protein
VIELHYWPTPNGKKVTILLEELGLAYVVVPVNIGRGDQFDDRFLAISPNNRMPAIVDTAPADGGAPISLFESLERFPISLHHILRRRSSLRIRWV